MQDWLKYIGLTLLVLFLQVMLVDNLHLFGVCHPYIYLWVLLMLPIDIPRWLQMFIGVAIGGILDLFAHTPGIHMAACVLATYLRPLMLTGFVQDAERLKGGVTIETIGPDNYLRLLALLVVTHHALLFLLEAFTFAHFGYTLLQILVSSVSTFLLVLLFEYVRKST